MPEAAAHRPSGQGGTPRPIMTSCTHQIIRRYFQGAAWRRWARSLWFASERSRCASASSPRSAMMNCSFAASACCMPAVSLSTASSCAENDESIQNRFQ